MMTAATAGGRDRPRVLIFTGCYPPGFRGGGPVRSIANLVAALAADFDFWIVTLDRDRPGDPSYPGIVPDRWQGRDGAQVLYLPRAAVSMRRLLTEIIAARPAVLYLNGFFDPLFTLRVLLARRMGRLGDTAVILAPRGDCSAGALEVKRRKKAIFVRVSRWAGLYRGLTWHASSELECRDILTVTGTVTGDQVHVVPNLTDLPPEATSGKPLPRQAGALRVCFVSRISPKKNLDFALRVLADVRVPVLFTIYGPVEDPAYWAAGRELIDRLPDHIRAHYGGELRPAEVRQTLVNHDLLFLPTRGENFGHVIHEALSAGVPVLISDQTPWTNLEAHGVGWELPLDAPGAFARTIEAASALSPRQFEAMAVRAIAFAEARADRAESIRRTRDLLRGLAVR